MLQAQSLDHLDSYAVDEFYQKIELDYGTLDESGYVIDHIYAKTDIDLDDGKYEVELSDGPGDLYEIRGTNIFVKFIGYFGYAGYSTSCILEVFYNSATIYKLN